MPLVRRVLIESPFAGKNAYELDRNRRYLLACLRDSLSRGEAPFASHGFYPQVLDDTKPEERKQGMGAGFAWGAVADLVAFYTDFGMSGGMKAGLERADANGTPVEGRRLPAWAHGDPEEFATCVCGGSRDSHYDRVGPRFSGDARRDDCPRFVAKKES